MGTVSSVNKMRTQTLCDQGYRANAIMAAHTHKTSGSSVPRRKFVSVLIKQPQRLNARLAVQWSAEIRTLGHKHRAC